MKNFLITISVLFCISGFSAEVRKNLFGAKKGDTIEGQERFEKLKYENDQRELDKEQKFSKIQNIVCHPGITQRHGTIISIQPITALPPSIQIGDAIFIKKDDEDMEDDFSSSDSEMDDSEMDIDTENDDYFFRYQ